MRVRCVDTNASARDEWVMLVGWGGTPKSINAQFQIAPIRGHKSIIPRHPESRSRNVSAPWAPLQRAGNTRVGQAAARRDSRRIPILWTERVRGVRGSSARAHTARTLYWAIATTHGTDEVVGTCCRHVKHAFERPKLTTMACPAQRVRVQLRCA